MIYLAAPLTHPDPAVMSKRTAGATHHACMMWQAGITTYSPLTLGAAFAGLCADQTHEWWLSHCLPFLDRSDEMVILAMADWRLSVGVAIEVKFARSVGIPISVMHPWTGAGWTAEHFNAQRKPLAEDEVWPVLEACTLPGWPIRASRRPSISMRG